MKSVPSKLCSFGLVLPASANWFHCVPFSKGTERAITFLVLNSNRDVEKSVVPVTYLFPSSKFFNVTDAEA